MRLQLDPKGAATKCQMEVDCANYLAPSWTSSTFSGRSVIECLALKSCGNRVAEWASNLGAHYAG